VSNWWSGADDNFAGNYFWGSMDRGMRKDDRKKQEKIAAEVALEPKPEKQKQQPAE